MTINNKFNIGEIVYLKTDPDQHPRMVVGMSVRPNVLIYILAFGSNESYHYELEISNTKDTFTVCGMN
jgi:hypothetical protein